MLVETVIAGLLVALATVPANPLALATDTDVTVPVPAAETNWAMLPDVLATPAVVHSQTTPLGSIAASPLL
jgi:hypothetical protein